MPKCVAAVLPVILGVGFTAVVLLRDPPFSDDTEMRPTPPALFGDPPMCANETDPLGIATRLEEEGRLYEERYPYDPGDGVRAVARLQRARSCYLAVGYEAHADRVGSRASRLVSRVEVDYASARLVFETALLKERWAVANAELRRLLRLTAHLPRRGYVNRLHELRGKVAMRASGM